jgi:hypothetical protein
VVLSHEVIKSGRPVIVGREPWLRRLTCSPISSVFEGAQEPTGVDI